jgi:hypothetical protein
MSELRLEILKSRRDLPGLADLKSFPSTTRLDIVSLRPMAAEEDLLLAQKLINRLSHIAKV